MVDNFYFLAAYTAASAVGFAEEDAQDIARSTRYVEDCTGYTVPDISSDSPENPIKALRFWPAFHYPPGDFAQIKKRINPGLLESPDPLTTSACSLICLPQSNLIQSIVQNAKNSWDKDSTEVEMSALQEIGFAMHALCDSFLNQGFVGLSQQTLNSAGTILRAKPPRRDQMRSRLNEAMTAPLQSVFETEPYVLQPAPTGFLGREQLGRLADQPSAIFSYLSCWAEPPLLDCVNPLRYAYAYLQMRSALNYIRGASAAFDPQSPPEDVQFLLTLACYFSTVDRDEDLPDSWAHQFPWLKHLPYYIRPTIETERDYINTFQMQAMRHQRFMAQTCAPLFLYGQTLKAIEQASEKKATTEPAAPLRADTPVKEVQGGVTVGH